MEFKILFQYNSKSYKARVVKSAEGNRMAYAIRPKSLVLAKGYGPQTLIFKENNQFSCDSQIGENTPEYVQALVKALKEQDINKENGYL
jgi:hypothetical protein